MPTVMNIVEAFKYKEKYPNRRVYYKGVYTVDSQKLYFIEDVWNIRDEFRFELTEGDYPHFWDQDDYGWSNIYNRHVLGELHCETEEEEIARLEEEKIKQEILLEKEKNKLDQQIETLKKKRDKLK